VIDNPSVASDILDRCPDTPTFFETHASYLPRLAEFLSVAGDPRLRGILVPSEYNRRLVIERTSVPPDRVFVIHNTVSRDLFSGKAAPSLSSNPIVLWVGRLEEPKNPHDLMRVAELFERRRSELRFLVIGDAPDYADYVAGLTSVCGRLPSNVTFVRNVAHVHMGGYYRAVARSGGALLSTSNFESAPMVLLEAMLLGCPIVSSAVGGIPLMVHHRRTGLLFPPGDVETAAALVDDVTSDPGLRARMVQQARHYIETHHSPASAGRAWRSLFGSSAMGSGPASLPAER
jgi:glycosyltransferase involved in cell wall biosynthesis